MTREQAKGNLIHAIRWNDMPKKEALEMAIKALEQEPKYCDRNICLRNEYNNIGCDECEITKSGDDYKYIQSISKPTGIDFDEEQEQLDFVQPHKRIPVTLTVESGDCISRQAVLDIISELNAISFYEAQEDSKGCYYEIRQAIKNMQPVKLQERTGNK